MSAENDVEVWGLFEQLLTFLLRDTATDTDDQVGAAILDRLETAEVAIHLALCPVPDRTGVEQNQVGIFC